LPTHEELAAFVRDYARLSGPQRQLFQRAVDAFVTDLAARRAFRPGLRVKGVRGKPGVYEMTWAADGRATFRYGASIREKDPHITWLRVGTHEIFE
jgi:hypothetical protein